MLAGSDNDELDAAESDAVATKSADAIDPVQRCR